MLRVGLTGGIGAGKSAVARTLDEHGAVVIDADQLAREVVEPGTPGLARVADEFGEEVLRPDGSLDRVRLGGIVFSEPERRQQLNAIVHPLVRERTAALIGEAPADAVVVQDIPLLVESGLAPVFALVVVVESPERIRRERLTRDRGMSADQVRGRLAAQATDEQRRAVADVVLVNDGTLPDLAAKVDRLWEDRLGPMAENVRRRRGAIPTQFAAVDARPEWAAEYRRLAARLSTALGDAVVAVEHVGPTATPGMAAPDVIDVLAVVRSSDGAALERVALMPESERVFWSADPGRPARIELRSP